MAKKFLIKNGYIIKKENYFAGKLGEIDIIAEKENIYHFVEVKTRTNKNFGWPEEAVGKNKIKKIILSAQDFIEKNNLKNYWEIDVISILLNNEKRLAEIAYLKNIGE